MKTPMCLYLGLIAIAILLTFDVLLHRSESFSLYTSLSYAAKAQAEESEPDSEPESYTMGDAMSKGFRDHGVGGAVALGGVYGTMKGGQAIYNGGKSARKAFLKQSCKNMVRRANRKCREKWRKVKMQGANCDGVENQLTNCKQNMEDQLSQKDNVIQNLETELLKQDIELQQLNDEKNTNIETIAELEASYNDLASKVKTQRTTTINSREL
tara:strand:+ start:6191 stop:6826 length:636 start_codon:yes stop_codon:yes gene_type:complete